MKFVGEEENIKLIFAEACFFNFNVSSNPVGNLSLVGFLGEKRVIVFRVPKRLNKIGINGAGEFASANFTFLIYFEIRVRFLQFFSVELER